MQNVKLGAQNMHWEKSGAFTGEISAPMLRELFVRYVVLGHSERRTLFGETDEIVNRKVHAALEATLRADRLHRRDAGGARRRAGRGSARAAGPREPRRRLGANELRKTVDRLRARLGDRHRPHRHARAGAGGARLHPQAARGDHRPAPTAEKVRIQYGGSVKPANAAELMRQPDIDGALVGGASLDPRGFAEIIKTTADLERA